MIDIVTVVFREELDVLKLQAQSIDLYCHTMGLDQIYVVINDDTMSTEDIDINWWGSFSNRVKVIHRQSWGIVYSNNGWLTQQLLKLLTAEQSNTTWSMVLDAKTIIVQEVDPLKIFAEDGRLTWGYMPSFPVFEPARIKVSELFGIEQTEVIGPAGVPFFFHNKTVKNMIKEIEIRTGERFAKWFQDAGTVTEFMLYSGYVQLVDGTLEKRYMNGCLNNYNPCNVCHSEVDRFDNKLLEMQAPGTITTSIHRNAWSELSNKQKEDYYNFLRSKGIVI